MIVDTAIVDTAGRKSNSDERITQQFNAQGKLVQVNGDDIEARLEPCAIEAGGQMPDVGRRHAAKDALLVTVHGKLSRDAVTAAARLHLHEAEHVALPRDQVEIAAKLARAPAPRDDGKAVASKKEVSSLFAAFPRDGRRRLGHRMKSSHPPDQSFHPT